MAQGINAVAAAAGARTFAAGGTKAAVVCDVAGGDVASSELLGWMLRREPAERRPRRQAHDAREAHRRAEQPKERRLQQRSGQFTTSGGGERRHKPTKRKAPADGTAPRDAACRPA